MGLGWGEGSIASMEMRVQIAQHPFGDPAASGGIRVAFPAAPLARLLID